jgi:hypothetical protein
MPTTELVPTSVGTAGITWYLGGEHPRAVLVVGHGCATGVEAPDLQAIAGVLPLHGITVALVEQPWRVSGSWTSSRPAVLDTAWRELWQRVARHGLPLIAGGRSAGSQVACRTARDLGARAVLALAYPLNGPGSPQELLATGLPTLIVQGGNDPYGRPAQFPTLPSDMEMVAIPAANHVFSVPGSGQGQRAALDQLTSAVVDWLSHVGLEAADPHHHPCG